MTRLLVLAFASLVTSTTAFAGPVVVVAPRPVIVPRVAPAVRVAPPTAPKAAAATTAKTGSNTPEGAAPSSPVPVIVAPVVVPPQAQAARASDCESDRAARTGSKSGKPKDGCGAAAAR